MIRWLSHRLSPHCALASNLGLTSYKVCWWHRSIYVPAGGLQRWATPNFPLLDSQSLFAIKPSNISCRYHDFWTVYPSNSPNEWLYIPCGHSYFLSMIDLIDQRSYTCHGRRIRLWWVMLLSTICSKWNNHCNPPTVVLTFSREVCHSTFHTFIRWLIIFKGALCLGEEAIVIK